MQRAVRFEICPADNGMFCLNVWVIQAVAGGHPTKALDKTDGPFFSKAEARSFAKTTYGAQPHEVS